MRAKKEDVYAIEKHINRVLEYRHSKYRVSVQWAYGKPRAHLVYADTDKFGTGEFDLSPRVSVSEMILWLTAFYDGLTFEEHYNETGK